MDQRLILTVGDAARECDLGPDRIRQALRRGELTGQRTVGGQYIIGSDELARWRNVRRLLGELRDAQRSGRPDEERKALIDQIRELEGRGE